MNDLKESCSFCFIPNLSLTDLKSKKENELNLFEKISLSLCQLGKLLNENFDRDFMICDKCCDTVETVYQFNETCFRNVKKLLLNPQTVKSEDRSEDFHPPFELTNWEQNEEIFIKNESNSESQNNDNVPENSKFSKDLSTTLEVSDSTEMYQGKMKNMTKIKRKTIPRKNEKSGQKRKILGKKEKFLENIDEKSEKKAVGTKISGEDLSKSHSNENVEPISEKPTSPKIKKKYVKVRNKTDRFPCETCGKVFNRKENLTKHFLIHAGIKSFVCDICGRCFTLNNQLKTHMSIHTGEKNYKCEICEREFGQLSVLIKHRSVHTGEKPHLCDECGKCFRLKYQLRRHEIIHIGKKVYNCDVCEKAFLRRGDLVRHTRVHTGEKPYSCDICAVHFSVKRYLDKHNLKFHYDLS